MENLYEKNGLVFWTEREILLREHFVKHFSEELKELLKTLNSAFEFVRVEVSQLTPNELISDSYTADDVFRVDDELTLRPETTMGSYVYAKHLLNTHNSRKVRLPLCVWQHGKSFRREQDKTLANMRLKEFYQLEFQIIFSKTTANDYYPAIVRAVSEMIARAVAPTRVEASDRLPSYATETQDVIMVHNDMEVCSISRRTDYENANVVEVAIGTDRCTYCFVNKPS